jgi:VPDSG-CTERM motif
MRTKLIVLVALCVAGQAYANMIPLSGFRSVSASGVAGGLGGGGQSYYSQTQSLSAPLGYFDANVSGSADWTDPVPVTQWYGLMGSYHADSLATQTSTITPDQISVSASLSGSTSVSLAGPYGPANSSASSIFEVSFNVLTPLEYQLDASRAFYFHDMPLPGFDFFLTSSNYGTILDNTSLSGANYFSGILLPDVYTLGFNADISTVPDPLGDLKGASYSMNLRVAGVPDAGSTSMLLGMAFVILIAVHRKWSPGNASPTPESN